MVINCRSFVVVEKFPQTANGKLDRNALPDPPDDLPSNPQRNDERKVDLSSKSAVEGETEDFSMVNHVCALVESLLGYRPSPSSTFASIGVDSLGSILFIRQLSDSFDGFRLSPNEVFGKGVTVESFSVSLYNKLHHLKPELLEAKNIHYDIKASQEMHDANGGVVDKDQGSSDSNASSSDVRVLRLGHGSSSLPALETFDDRLLSNRDSLEGLRGLFMLIVLWDHFHGTMYQHTISSAILADTTMFVIISGFTTALTTRRNRAADRTKPWDWKAFLVSRAIGLFPVLWLVLIVNGPRWPNQNKWAARFYRTRFSAGDRATCVVLYIIGQQGWVRPMCHYLGPNDVLYASLIWNCFLMYAGIRILFDFFQRRIRKLSPTVSGAGSEVSVTPTFIGRFAATITRVGDNDPDSLGLTVAVVGSWAVVYLVLFFVTIFIYMKASIY